MPIALFKYLFQFCWGNPCYSSEWYIAVKALALWKRKNSSQCYKWLCQQNR